MPTRVRRRLAGAKIRPDSTPTSRLERRRNLIVGDNSAKSAFQVHQQKRDRSRGNTRYPRGLTERFRPLLIELLLHFDRQATTRAVVEIPGQARRFKLFLPAHLVALALDLYVIFDLDIDLHSSLVVRQAGTCSGQRY